MLLFRAIRLLLMLGPALSASAQERTTPGSESIADPQWLREYLERARGAHRMPAIAAAVVVDGKILAASTVGFRKARSPERATWAGSVWSSTARPTE